MHLISSGVFEKARQTLINIFCEAVLSAGPLRLLDFAGVSFLLFPAQKPYAASNTEQAA